MECIPSQQTEEVDKQRMGTIIERTRNGIRNHVLCLSDKKPQLIDSVASLGYRVGVIVFI